MTSVMNTNEISRGRRPPPAWQLVGVGLAGAGDLLVAGRPAPFSWPGPPPGRSRVAGGQRTGAVRLRRDQEEKTCGSRCAANRFELALWLYGQVAVNQLELLAASADETKAYACHFYVTSRTCSLLMLDSEQVINGIKRKNAFIKQRSVTSTGGVAEVNGCAQHKAAFWRQLKRLGNAGHHLQADHDVRSL